MTIRVARFVISLLFLSSLTAFAQTVPQGVGEGYDGEWKYVSQQLLDLAQAIPAEKFAWRPAQGVRSTSEVYMHIAFANFYLLTSLGAKMPADWSGDMEKKVTAKADVVNWLKRSQEAVRTARGSGNPAELQRKVTLFKKETTADSVFLRLLVHNNEHLGQLIAYARMSGVVPPWSQ